MILFLLSFFIIALASAGLGIGVVLGREPLQGSCGGDSVVSICPICRQKDKA